MAEIHKGGVIGFQPFCTLFGTCFNLSRRCSPTPSLLTSNEHLKVHSSRPHSGLKLLIKTQGCAQNRQLCRGDTC
jgi:hypothetical protein